MDEKIRIFSVYRITNLVNNKIYIGKTGQNPPIKRWYEHTYKSRNVKNHNRPLYASMAKRGIDKFTFEIIAEANSFENISIMEVDCIKQYDSKNKKNGYNLTDGGEGGELIGYKHSEQTKLNMSIAQQNRILSEETLERLKIAGRKGKGRKHSADAKKRISVKNKAWRKNNKFEHSEETKIKMSKANTGSNNPFYGKKHTEESLEKQKLIHRKNAKRKLSENDIVNIKLLKSNGLIYKEIANIFNCSIDTICDAINGTGNYSNYEDRK